VTNVDTLSQTFQVQVHQYLQWVPTESEYNLILEKGGKKPDIFIPKFLPSNVVGLDFEEEEYREGFDPVHILRPNGTDIWGTSVKLNTNQILLGISRKFLMTISSPLELRNYPFDCQSLHIFFESLVTTDQIVMKPSPLYDSCVDLEMGAMASDVCYKMHPPVIEFSAFGSDESSK
jgi:hypothetical protein